MALKSLVDTNFWNPSTCLHLMERDYSGDLVDISADSNDCQIGEIGWTGLVWKGIVGQRALRDLAT